MGVTTFPSGNAAVAKFWSKRLARESIKKTEIMQYAEDSSDAALMIESGLSKEAGDRVTVTLRLRGTGRGVTEDTPQEGNEESLGTSTDNLTINELSHAFRSKKKGITQQRIPWNIAAELNAALQDWWAERFDMVGFAHACGYTPFNSVDGIEDGAYNGFNTILAPSTGRQLWCSADHTSDQTLDSDDVFALSHIDRAVELAQTGGSTGLPPIRPIKNATLNGMGAEFACYIHPSQATQLRADASQWSSIEKAKISGGKTSANGIVTGVLGVYNKTAIMTSANVTPGVHSGTGASVANTRRAVFMGAQALTLAFGKGYGPEKWQVEEEPFDYKRQVGFAGICVFGIKGSRFTINGTSHDFGKIVLSSYAAHAA